ncbi:MAG: DUF4340 domain-containing protein, partial [Planctomycetes bacterium]|nr:DUF4340 domain-containing protein [Planctomycetota bacterium]
MQKSIVGSLAFLAVLVVIWAVYSSRPLSTRSEALSAGFQAVREAKLDQVSKVTLAKGKTAPVELAKSGDKWVVASSYAYPADGEKVDKIVKALDAIESGDESGSAEQAHAEFEVDSKKGGFVTAFDKDGKELAKVVVGKTAPNRSISTTRVYLRFGNEPTVYAVESDLRNAASLWGKDVEAKNYLLKKVLDIPEEMEGQSVRLSRPDKPDVIVERKWREVPVEKPKDPAEETKDGDAAADAEKKEGEGGETKDEKAEEKKPETKKEEYFVVTSGSETKQVEKNEEYQVRGLVNRVKDFSIEEGAEPKDLAEYGLDKPQLKAEVSYRKKDKPEDELKTLTLLFGNAKKDDKGTTTGYYTAVEGDAHKGRIYLVQQWTFDGWNKEMKDFLPKPKEEPKKEEPKPPEPAAGAAAPPATSPSPAPSPAPAGTAPATPAPQPPEAVPTPGPTPAPATPPAPPGNAPPPG